MKLLLLALATFLGTSCFAAIETAHTRIISKVTDTYQVRSGKNKLIESEFEVGTFNDLDGMATDVQTVAEKEKGKTSLQSKLDKVLKISGLEGLPITSKKISDEVCIKSADKKYCSTSIELTF